MSAPYEGDSSDAKTPGIKGSNTVAGGAGVYGVNNSQVIVSGKVVGGPGVYGLSQNDDGIHGESNNILHAGVAGINNATGIHEVGTGRGGVYGFGKEVAGVRGESGGTDAGVLGVNNSGGPGVQGNSTSAAGAGVSGVNNRGHSGGCYLNNAAFINQRQR